MLLDREAKKKEIVKGLIERLDVRETLAQVSAKEDAKATYLIPLNGVLLATSLTIIFSADDSIASSASLILLSITAFTTSISIALSLWYISRRNHRTEIFKAQQDKMLNKVEKHFSRVLDLFESTAELKVKVDATEGKITRAGADEGAWVREIMQWFEERYFFLFNIITDLAMKETRLNSNKSFEQTLDERFAGVKLIIDNLSDKTRNWGLIVGFILVLAAVLVKFLAE